MNGTNNSSKYEVLKDIKYGLLKEFDKEIKRLPIEKQIQIVIAQHKELLHTAELEKIMGVLMNRKLNLREVDINLAFQII